MEKPVDELLQDAHKRDVLSLGGEGLQFYRCLLCSSVVSVWDIRDHGACPNCNGVRIQPSNLTLWEKITQIIKHPRIWEWKDQTIQTIEGGQAPVPANVGGDSDAV